MGHRCGLARDEDRHSRRSHGWFAARFQLSRRSHRLGYLAIPPTECSSQAVSVYGLLGIERDMPGLVRRHLHCRFDKRLDSLDRRLRGNLTRLMPTHPVGDNEQPQVLANPQIVFVG
jgi:hypothetical protein